MPDRSVDCIVTSPPYWALRDYGADGQYGLEPTPEAYVDNLRGVFAEAHRVLADEGTCWLNLGDCYAANSDGWRRGESYNARQPLTRPLARVAVAPKNLLGMPWRVAFALQHDGWILRNALVWHKPNAMPYSVQDRLSCRYELIFLLVKQRRYWFDLDPIREPLTRQPNVAGHATTFGGRKGAAGCLCSSNRRRPRRQQGTGKYGNDVEQLSGKRHGAAILPTGQRHTAAHRRGKNPGDVWSISTRPFRQAHFAVFPIDIPLRCVAAGCPPGGTVLDPFAGTATTGLAARRLGRQFIGVELSAEYCEACHRPADRSGPSRGFRRERRVTAQRQRACSGPPKHAGNAYALEARREGPANPSGIRVITPDEPPDVTPAAARVLLRILLKAHAQLSRR